VGVQAGLRLVPERALQPQPLPRARRLLLSDGLAGDRQPARPRPGLRGGPPAPPAAAVGPAGPGGADRRLVRHPRGAVAGHRRQPRVAHLDRPGRRADNRAVALRLASPPAALRSGRGPRRAAGLPAHRVARQGLAAGSPAGR
jgi:hypothetical protein